MKASRTPFVTTTISVLLLWVLVRYWRELFFNPNNGPSHISTLSQLHVRAAPGYHVCPSAMSPDRVNFNTSSVDPSRHALVFPVPYLNNSNWKRVAAVVSTATQFSDLPIVLLTYKPAVVETSLQSFVSQLEKDNVRRKVVLKHLDLPFDGPRVARQLRICRGERVCPALAHFMVLHVFGLHFRKVIVLDWRIKFLKSFHHLLACDQDLIFTSSPAKYIDTGMMVANAGRPQLVAEMVQYYNDLLTIASGESPRGANARKGAASDTGTSADVEHVKLLLSDVQHFLYQYFIDGRKAPDAGLEGLLPGRALKVVEVSRCLYLFEDEDELCNGELRTYGLPVFVRKGRPHGRNDVLTVDRSVKQCRVDGWILGTRKGGTSSLYTYLSKHPDVISVRLKGGPSDGEIMYRFPDSDSDQAEKYNALVETWGARSDLQEEDLKGSRDLLPRKVIFDSSVHRLVADPWPMLSACGHRSNRFVAILRDPISRCLSQMQMRARLGTKGMTLETNLSALIKTELDTFLRVTKGQTDWLDDAFPEMLFSSSRNCIYEGLYVAHLKRWFYYVGREQMYIMFTERMVQSGQTEFRELLRFFGLDTGRYNYSDLSQRYNAAPQKAREPSNLQLTATLRRELERAVAPYNQALEELLGIELKW